MTYRSKVILFSAILLGLFVTATSLLWVLDSNGTTRNSSVLTIVAAVVLSIASVVFIYLKKVQKSSIEKLLDSNFYKEYELVKDAIALSQLPHDFKKDITGDILEMLIAAQKAGRPVSDVISNPQAFADEIIGSFAKPSSFFLLNLFDCGAFLVIFVILTNLAIWFENSSGGFFNVKIDISMIVLFLLISFVLIPLSKSLTTTKRNWAFLLPLAFGIVYILVMEVLRRQFYSVEAARTFLDEGLILIPNNWALILYIAAIPLLMAMKSICRRLLLKRT